MPTPTMIVVAGVNGAGKSTYTQTLKNKFPHFIVIDPDAIAKSITNDISTIHTKTISAGKETLKLVQSCIAEKNSFIVETTISGKIYLKYLQKAKQAGFRA